MLTRVAAVDFETTLRIATHWRAVWARRTSRTSCTASQAENIFLTKDEENKLVAKLVDFGLPNSTKQTSGPDQ